MKLKTILILIIILLAPASFAAEPIISTIATVPRAMHSFSAEQVGGSNAHILILDNPDFPDYKYQFLTNGLRLSIDRGAGYEILISEVQTAPEYMKQQGAFGSFVWNSYGLDINTAGPDVLQGWDKIINADGTVDMIRTFETFEEGIAEELIEVWKVPAKAEDLGRIGIKTTLSMTKNRGIIETNGVMEGTWRIRWSLSGISNIVSNDNDIKDGNNNKLRKKAYDDFLVDWNDFDNLFENDFVFSEISVSNKAELLAYEFGTAGNRILDPALVASSVNRGWLNSQQNNVFYNGENFFLIWSNSSNGIFYNSSPDGINWSNSGLIVDDVHASSDSGIFGVYLVNDSKLDFVYHREAGLSDYRNVKSCNISSLNINCNAGDDFSLDVSAHHNLAVTRSNNRIYVLILRATSTDVFFKFNYLGDAIVDVNNIQDNATIIDLGITDQPFLIPMTLIPYEIEDKVLIMYTRDLGGPSSDGIYSITYTNNSEQVGTEIQVGNLNDIGFVSTPIRISDTNFTYILKAENASGTTMVEYTWNNATWTEGPEVDAETDEEGPSLFYDRISGNQYLFAIDTGATPHQVERWLKPNGSTWQTEVAADEDPEAEGTSLVVAQLHEPPDDSTRTTPRFLVWAYRVENGAFYDLKVGILQLNDIIPPSITNCTVNNTALTCNDFVQMSCNVTDDSAIDEVFFGFDDTDGKNFEEAVNVTGDTYFIDKQYTHATAGNETYNFTNATAIDIDNNLNITLFNISFNYSCLIDTQEPNVILISPTDNQISNNTNHTFTADATDDMTLANATFYWNISGNFIANETISLTGVSDIASFARNISFNNTIIWNIEACDTSNNCNFSASNFTLIINQTFPFILPVPVINLTLISPENNSIENSTSVTFTFFINITGANASLYIDNLFNLSLNTTNGSNSYPAVTFLQNGTHEWFVNATFNITAHSGTFNFTLNLTSAPIEDAFSLTECVSTNAQAMLLGFFILLALFFIFFGIAVKLGFIELFGSILLFIISLYIFQCIFILALAFMLLAFLFFIHAITLNKFGTAAGGEG